MSSVITIIIVILTNKWGLPYPGYNHPALLSSMDSPQARSILANRCEHKTLIVSFKWTWKTWNASEKTVSSFDRTGRRLDATLALNGQICCKRFLQYHPSILIHDLSQKMNCCAWWNQNIYSRHKIWSVGKPIWQIRKWKYHQCDKYDRRWWWQRHRLVLIRSFLKFPAQHDHNLSSGNFSTHKNIAFKDFWTIVYCRCALKDLGIQVHFLKEHLQNLFYWFFSQCDLQILYLSFKFSEVKISWGPWTIWHSGQFDTADNLTPCLKTDNFTI